MTQIGVHRHIEKYFSDAIIVIGQYNFFANPAEEIRPVLVLDKPPRRFTRRAFL